MGCNFLRVSTTNHYTVKHTWTNLQQMILAIWTLICFWSESHCEQYGFLSKACFVSLISFGRVDEAKGASMNHHQSSWIGNFNVTYALLLSTSRSERLVFFHQHNGLGWSGDRCGQVAPLPCCWWDLRGSNKCTVSAVGSLRFPSFLGLFFYPQKTSIFSMGPWGTKGRGPGVLYGNDHTYPTETEVGK